MGLEVGTPGNSTTREEETGQRKNKLIVLLLTQIIRYIKFSFPFTFWLNFSIDIAHMFWKWQTLYYYLYAFIIPQETAMQKRTQILPYLSRDMLSPSTAISGVCPSPSTDRAGEDKKR